MSEMKAQWDEFFGAVRRESNVGESAIAPQSKQRKGAVRTEKGAIRTLRPNSLEVSVDPQEVNYHIYYRRKKKVV